MTGTADLDALLSDLDALLSVPGAELLASLRHQAITPDTALALGTRLRETYPAGLVAAALAQHGLRLAARAKFSRAMDMYFTRAGLEQASAEVVARHRQARFRGAGAVADLCCGIGGDLAALAGEHQVRAVDRDPLHLRMATLNAAAYGVGGSVRPVQGDVREAALAGVDAVFIDPSRRTAGSTGGRRLGPGASEPPLAWCLDLAGRVPAVGIKAAPGIARDAVPEGWELEFVAVGRDLKEAVAWSPSLAGPGTRATILPGGHALTPQPGPPVPVAAPGPFLLDPNPAVTRAGLVEELARPLGAWKIDQQIAFLCTDTPVCTPFARTLQVIDSGPWNQKRLPARLRDLDIGALDIRRRGLAGDVGQLHRQLKLTGSRRATLVMTRARNQPWGLVCLDLPGCGATGGAGGPGEEP
jgi:SAM-dependent methyltransferase